MRFVFASLLAAALAGCGCNPNDADCQQRDTARPIEIVGKPAVTPSSTVERFQIQRVQVFEDGTAYDGKRAVYVIVDRKTGAEFVGVSGVGISELGDHSLGKTRQPDER